MKLIVRFPIPLAIVSTKVVASTTHHIRLCVYHQLTSMCHRWWGALPFSTCNWQFLGLLAELTNMTNTPRGDLHLPDWYPVQMAFRHTFFSINWNITHGCVLHAPVANSDHRPYSGFQVLSIWTVFFFFSIKYLIFDVGSRCKPFCVSHTF